MNSATMNSLIQKNIHLKNLNTMALNAVSGKEVNITSNQRLSFSHNMEDKLKPGFYRVAVYADLGSGIHRENVRSFKRVF